MPAAQQTTSHCTTNSGGSHATLQEAEAAAEAVSAGHFTSIGTRSTEPTPTPAQTGRKPWCGICHTDTTTHPFPPNKPTPCQVWHLPTGSMIAQVELSITIAVWNPAPCHAAQQGTAQPAHITYTHTTSMLLQPHPGGRQLCGTATAIRCLVQRNQLRCQSWGFNEHLAAPWVVCRLQHVWCCSKQTTRSQGAGGHMPAPAGGPAGCNKPAGCG